MHSCHFNKIHLGEVVADQVADRRFLYVSIIINNQLNRTWDDSSNKSICIKIKFKKRVFDLVVIIYA